MKKEQSEGEPGWEWERRWLYNTFKNALDGLGR